ncbi:MAG: lysophospholipid acyltransferase family protein [Chloroflexota bacterium]
MILENLEEGQSTSLAYKHSLYERRRRFLRFLIKHIGFNLLAKLNRVEGLENIPLQGPVILMINHIAFIDPIVVLHVVPRHIVPLAKVEVYDYPVVGIFPRLWGVIPVRREEVDRRAIQQVLQVLKAGEIVLVAPEGTRGPQLKQGKEGVAYLASRSGAPVIPVAVDGTEGFPALRFTSAWRQPGAVIRFGKPFRYRREFRRAGRSQLRQMTDEAMYLLSAMLPPHRRGVYSDFSQATQETIEWVESTDTDLCE